MRLKFCQLRMQSPPCSLELHYQEDDRCLPVCKTHEDCNYFRLLKFILRTSIIQHGARFVISLNNSYPARIILLEGSSIHPKISKWPRGYPDQALKIYHIFTKISDLWDHNIWMDIVDLDLYNQSGHFLIQGWILNPSTQVNTAGDIKKGIN